MSADDDIPIAWLYRTANGRLDIVESEADSAYLAQLDAFPVYRHVPPQGIEALMRLHDKAAWSRYEWEHARVGNESSRTNLPIKELLRLKAEYELARRTVETAMAALLAEIERLNKGWTKANDDLLERDVEAVELRHRAQQAEQATPNPTDQLLNVK